MRMPPMTIQIVAPQAVEKLRRCASLTNVVIFPDFDLNVLGENMTPITKRTIVVKSRIIEPMMSTLVRKKVDKWFDQLSVSTN